MIQPLPRKFRRKSPRPAALLAGCTATLLAAPAFPGAIVTGASYTDYDNALLPGVVQDTVGRVTYGFSGSGSGVYLGDGWVLTAAHVGDDDLDFDFTLGGTTYASADVILHPDWNRADITDGNDLALIQLQQPIPGVTGATLYDGNTSNLLGKTATLSGYGATGDGDTGGTGPLGTLHAGQNRIDRRGGQTPFGDYDNGIVFVDFDDPQAGNDGYAWSPNAALTYEYLITRGDSGGGLFVNDDGQTVLAGVTSFLLANDGDIDGSYGDIGGFFTLEGMLPWIAQATGDDVLLVGDANRNGTVEQGDLNAVLNNWGDTSTLWAHGDLDGSGLIDQGDLNAILNNWGAVTTPDFSGASFAIAAVPEPTTALLLLVPGAMLRRRR